VLSQNQRQINNASYIFVCAQIIASTQRPGIAIDIPGDAGLHPFIDGSAPPTNMIVACCRPHKDGITPVVAGARDDRSRPFPVSLIGPNTVTL
jgi:hypothetical protein